MPTQPVARPLEDRDTPFPRLPAQRPSPRYREIDQLAAGDACMHDLVERGKRLIDPRVASRVSTQLKEPADDPRFASLGLRERQVLALIADGFTNRQIGEKLGLAEKTVKNYVSSLLAKLGLERRTQAAVLQLEHRGRA